MTETRQRLNRARVVDMAAALADVEGIDAVSLQRIANDAGVKQPALYRHVTGIEELLKLLALRAREMLAHALNDSQTGLTRRDSVTAVARTWRSFVQQHPGVYSATDRVPSTGDEDIEQSLSNVVSALSHSLDGYSLDSSQRAHCARSLRSSLHGFCVLEKDNGHPEPYALDEGLSNLVDLFCRGVEALEATERSTMTE